MYRDADQSVSSPRSFTTAIRSNSEMGSKDESGASSSLLAYGGGEKDGDDQQPGATVKVSVSLVPAKVYVSASAKAAAEGPDDVSDAAAGVPGTAKASDAESTAEPEG